MFHDNASALQSLAVTLQIPLSFNEDGVCRLAAEHDAAVTLEGSPDARQLRINGIVGSLNDEHGVDSLRLLLEANFNGQGTGACALAVDGFTGDVVLGRGVDVGTLGHEGLEPVLAEFLDYLAFWSAHLGQLTTATADTVAQPDAASMRV